MSDRDSPARKQLGVKLGVSISVVQNILFINVCMDDVTEDSQNRTTTLKHSTWINLPNITFFSVETMWNAKSLPLGLIKCPCLGSFKAVPSSHHLSLCGLMLYACIHISSELSNTEVFPINNSTTSPAPLVALTHWPTATLCMHKDAYCLLLEPASEEKL